MIHTNKFFKKKIGYADKKIPNTGGLFKKADYD